MVMSQEVLQIEAAEAARHIPTEDLRAVALDEARISQEEASRKWSLSMPGPVLRVAAGLVAAWSASEVAIPATALATPAAKVASAHKQRNSATVRHPHYYDTSMFDGWSFNITHAGCGMTASSDAISYVKQRFINPNQIAVHSKPWYNNGVGKDGYDGHYMTGLGPQLARTYHVGYIRENLERAAYDVTVNHAAAIILAVPGPDHTFTDDSHYMAIERSIGEKVEIFDPNQPGHGQDKALWKIDSLQTHGVFNLAWVFFPDAKQR
jgi:hypothetical protein